MSCKKSQPRASGVKSVRSPYLVLDESHRLMVAVAFDDNGAWTELVEDYAHRNLQLVVGAQVREASYA